MKFKHRIWLLPIMTAAIVAFGIAVNSHFTSRTSAALQSVEHVQYPTVEALRAIRADVLDIQELLQRAVAEGDAAVIAAADQHAISVRRKLRAPTWSGRSFENGRIRTPRYARRVDNHQRINAG